MDLADPSLHHRVQQFVSLEARLLDEWRFEDWLALFHPEGRYWVPMSWDQPDPVNHISLYWEDLKLLRLRMERLQHEATASQLPRSRTSHQITNLMLDPAEVDGADLSARAAFAMTEYRRQESRRFAGVVRYALAADEGDAGFLMLQKRVDLLDCDSDAGHLRFTVPF